MVDVRSRRSGWRVLSAAAVACLLVVTVGDAARGAPASSADLHVPETRPAAAIYIVQMADPPVVAYEGGLAGLPATAPAPGQHVDPNSANVRRYAQFLGGRHAAVLAAVGATADAKFYDYSYSFNGFAATLTPAQASKVAAQPGVAAVSLDEFRQLLTDNTPAFLGLSGSGGLWEQLGGQGEAGEDVVIGVIDSGIWPEHPSFSDQIDLADRPGSSGKRTRAYGPPPADWHGTCQSGELWSQDDCNYKLIGARYFLEGVSRHGGQPIEYASARDHDGHGTHTASTAGGNAGVDPSIFGRDLGVGTISGIAPRARIAAYKACFGAVGCALTDLVAAIDSAVADGVDVINYSIGSISPQLLGSDDIAFLLAARAGVFVATSAGNSGPGASTIGSPASDPWVTSVGASTHSRYFLSTITLGNSATYTGGSVGPPLGTSPLVDGEDDCVAGLDPAEVAGAIVLCKRITGIARVSHGAAVAAAGGVGMILYDPPQTNVIPTDNHVVPTVHVFPGDAAAIKAYIAAAGGSATASFSGGNREDNPAAPDMAVFSSRGPNGAAGDIIKPDVTAPGVQILAGNSPTPFLGAPGQLFQAIQGTSMSSPHVAGVGALLVQAHPDWTPAMVKSALMTTGRQDVDKDDGTTDADPFDIGGGHIAPTPANDPGLVYNAGFNDYLAFLCTAGPEIFADPAATCTRLEGLGFSTDPSDLNLASIGIDALAGSQTVERTVTNVGPAGTYTVDVDAPPGIEVVVDPPTLPLGEGESAEYTVTFTRTDAAFDQWAFGSLTWSDDTHAVRSPIAVRPVALAFPAEVSDTGASGEHTYQVTFGYDGPFDTAVHGLVPATVIHDTVVDDPANDINVALDTGVGINEYTITVAAGTRHLRAALFDESTDGADDLDLYLFDPDDNLVAISGTATSEEVVDIVGPAEGDWRLVVHGWQTDGPDAMYDLFTWLIGEADAGNLTVAAPATAVLGATEDITLSWSNLAAATRFLGIVSYSDGTNEIGSTLVSITT